MCVRKPPNTKKFNLLRKAKNENEVGLYKKWPQIIFLLNFLFNLNVHWFLIFCDFGTIRFKVKFYFLVV